MQPEGSMHWCSMLMEKSFTFFFMLHNVQTGDKFPCMVLAWTINYLIL